MSDQQPAPPPPSDDNGEAATLPVGEPPATHVTPPPPAPPAGSGLFSSGWIAPLATGLIGLFLGIMIGAVGVGVVSAVWHHSAHDRDDDRGQHWQDDRPGPDRGPIFR